MKCDDDALFNSAETKAQSGQGHPHRKQWKQDALGEQLTTQGF